jgi:hypothetical protein
VEHQVLEKTAAVVIDELDRDNCFMENGYFKQDHRSFCADVARAAVHGWTSSNLQNVRAGYQSFDQFVLKVALTFDHYGPQLFRLLLPADPMKPQSCPMYRTALTLLYRYPQLHGILSPDDILNRTLDIAYFSRLAILKFKEEAALRTWLYAIMRNVVRYAARKEEAIRVEFDSYVETRLPDQNEDQPGKIVEKSEDLYRQLHLLEQLIAKAKARKKETIISPQLERAWVLWNDYFVDLYFLLDLPTLQGTVYKPNTKPPFPSPPRELVLGDIGRHNFPYTNYLGEGIGVLRKWTSSRTKADLSLSSAPNDESYLRGVVRIRRNEGKLFLKIELAKFQQDSTKEVDSAT